MSEQFPALPERYEQISRSNEQSWYINDAERPFSVATSVHSVGEARQESVDPAVKAARHILGGNMSALRREDGTIPYGPGHLDDKGRFEDAIQNMNAFFKDAEVNPANVRLLFPGRDYTKPLTILNVDEDPAQYDGHNPARLETEADFIYSYNPEIVLGVRPADCPIVIFSGETPEGRIGGMVHFAWRGAASGQYGDMERALDQLRVDRSTMKTYIAPGGQAETFRYDNGYKPDGKNNPVPVEGFLYRDLKAFWGPGGEKQYTFGLDTPNDVYHALIDMGLEPTQIFSDVSDTTALDSGYSSHSRAARLKESQTRDLVIAKFTQS